MIYAATPEDIATRRKAFIRKMAAQVTDAVGPRYVSQLLCCLNTTISRLLASRRP
jgi:hypothetical protein